jgi:hypothetical protein
LKPVYKDRIKKQLGGRGKMKRVVLKQVLIFLGLLILFVESGFTQQSSSMQVIGKIPDPQSTNIYQLQVGAFRITRNAETVFDRLKQAGFNPVYEQYQNLTRVMVRGINAADIPPYLERFKQAGFREAIIREERRTTLTLFNAKWEIRSRNSDFISFEFDEHGNYLVIAHNDAGDPAVHFGKYKVRSWNTLELEDFGSLVIQARMNNDVNFTFTALDADKALTYQARENQSAIDNSRQTSMLCRAWQSVTVNGKDVREIGGGHLVFFSRTGAFYVTYLNEDRSILGQWKWKDQNRREFIYSWDNWETLGIDRIHALTETYWKDEWAVDKYDTPPIWESAVY